MARFNEGDGIGHVAIVGLACRFPGAANVDEFWQNLRDGVESVSSFSDEDLKASGVDPALLANPQYVRAAATLKDVEYFDASFFGFSPREARLMDPQLRFFLECAWEALESAGYAASSSGAHVGVYGGANISSYLLSNLDGNLGPAGPVSHLLTLLGNDKDYLATHVSYKLNLKGPSISVQTACSTSLVAVHLACRGLTSYECDMALAGGVTIHIPHKAGYVYADGGILSPDGHCRAFDATARGTVLGSGVGIVALKRLADAIEDGDCIHAVIRGSAVNNDGSVKVGFTAPGVDGQAEVIALAQAMAGVDPKTITYIEAHGTGTALGDAIEIAALTQAFGAATQAKGFCAIGSVKTNFGHLEAAAGIAGLIKTVLALRHRTLPPSLHFQTPNPEIDFAGSPFYVNNVVREWKPGPAPRRAGVSSFGIGGTNAHVILEEGPACEPLRAGVERPVHILSLSAKNPAALRELAGRFETCLANTSETLSDISFTANTGRQHFTHRFAAVAGSTAQMHERVAGFVSGKQPAGVRAREVPSNGNPKVAFLFTGQGSQFVGMGKRLYDHEPKFRENLDRCADILRPFLPEPLLPVIFGEAGKGPLLNETTFTQPALFALEFALAELWRSWGVEPSAVMGHSVGEYVAACIAGIFSLEDGLKLVAERSRLMQGLPRDGAMAAVFAGRALAASLLVPHDGRVAIAAVNGPESCVISGARDAVDAILSELKHRGVLTRRLTVSHAFHSPLMDPVLGALERVAREITYSPPRIALIANLTGRRAGADEIGSVYWRRHAREEVKFAAGLESLCAEQCGPFLEIGPNPTLVALGRQAFPKQDGAWLASLRNGRDDWEQMLETLGELYVRGVDIDWTAFDRAYPRRRVVLPNYPFQRQRYWIEPVASLRAAEPRDAGHDDGDDCIYEIEWQSKARQETQSQVDRDSGGTWLILADQSGVGNVLAELLESRGQKCTRVFRRAAAMNFPNDELSIDPTAPDEFQRMLAALTGSGLARNALPFRGVVHLWALDLLFPDEGSAGELDTCQLQGFGSVLHLIQAVLACRKSEMPRLWLATRGAQPVGSHNRNLALSQSPIWGIGRVIALEHPEAWGGLVDLPSGRIETQAAALFQEIWDSDGEDEVALRDGNRWVARVVRRTLPAPVAPRFSLRSDASYLITGGLGGLGSRLARWMVERGARHLVLCGRQGLPERSHWDDLPRDSEAGRRVAAVRQLEELGATVKVARADVSNLSSLSALVDELRQSEWPSLRGVLHAAGVSRVTPITELDWEKVQPVLLPKIAGTWNLHQLTRSMDLDFFVCFSSVASVWGSKGFADYAAANHFLDCFVHYRRALGLSGLSVNWGPWDGGGMASAESSAQLLRTGLAKLDPNQATRALGRLLEAGVAQATVARVDWSVFKPIYEAKRRRPLIEHLGGSTSESVHDQSEEQAEIVQLLNHAGSRDRLEILLNHLRSHVIAVLGLDPDQPIDPRQGFFDLGMDSLIAVEFRNRLQVAVGPKFPLAATLVFDFPTLETLSGHLVQRMLSEAPIERAATIRVAEVEPIAIIGIGCRFPGGAESPGKFWHLLRDGVDAITEVPSDRWRIDDYYDPAPDAPGKMSSRCGGFIENIDLFDAPFFGIAPREAVSMDPQQRLLLEVGWEALENAGQAPHQLAGSRTGVFIGISTNDYLQLIIRARDCKRVDSYVGIGNVMSAAAGHLSYVLGLQGPSMAIDTACSSSLVAVHLASKSLHSHESDMALAGGVNLILSPATNVTLSRARMLSPDGRCKAFDVSADGFGRGEGCGVVVLKRLSNALSAGDRILGVIQGSAVNQDGRSSGITVPNGSAQQALIREALVNAGVEPSQIDYVEAHGTGTSLGDPIEVQALAAVLRERRSRENTLRLGSVKTNIGHLEAASGIAGLIKVVLSLQEEEIPPHLHLRQLNPHVDWNQLPLQIPTTGTEWRRKQERRRIAGISSFGFSGTNAHVVVEEGPERAEGVTEPEVPVHLLSLSGKSEAGLRELAGRYEEYLGEGCAASLGDICYTAHVGRSHFTHRVGLVAESREELREKLRGWREGRTVAGTASGEVRGSNRAKVAFLFTGQGSQYAGMGRGLYETEGVFRKALEQCEEVVKGMGGPSLRELLYGGGKELDQTEYTQPVLFALEYGLSEVWRSWGVEPGAVLGHSVGEYVAACVAGVFSLEEGLGLVVQRARMMQKAPGRGTMAAVMAGEERVAGAIRRNGGKVWIGAINGPESVVISGAREAVEGVRRELEGEGIGVQELKVSHAFHSGLMEPMVEEFRGVAGEVKYQATKIGVMRNVDGEMAEGEVLDENYWSRQIREPVRFWDGIRGLRRAGYEIFLEIGPEPVLVGMGKRCEEEGGGVWLGSLRKGRDDRRQMLEAAAGLYARGVELDWERYYKPRRHRKVSLPTYPFQRQRCWVSASAQSTTAFAANSGPGHPLLGHRIPSALPEIQFKSRLGPESPPLLGEHRLYGKVVVPGAVEVSMALDAAAATSGSRALKDLTFLEPIILPEDGHRTVQMILSPGKDGETSYKVYSCRPGSEDDRNAWTVHADGKICAAETHHQPGERGYDVDEIQGRCHEIVSSEDFYIHARKLGFEFGPKFRFIEKVWRKQDEALAQMRPGTGADDFESYILNPGLIDSIFTVIGGPRLFAEEALRQGNAFVPLGIDRVQFHSRPAGRLWCHAALRQHGEMNGEVVTGDLRVINDAGEPVVEIIGLHLRRARRDSLLRALKSHINESLYKVAWEPAVAAGVQEAADRNGARKSGTWLIFSDRGRLGSELAELLRRRGDSPYLVFSDTGYTKSDDEHFGVNPRSPEDFQRLLGEVTAAGVPPFRGVIHLWSLNEARESEENAQSLNAATEMACASALHLVQALQGNTRLESFRLWLATRGAQPVTGNSLPLAVGQSPLWGLGRVVAQEYPDWWGGLIDLDPAAPPSEAAMLVEEMSQRDGEDQLAFRAQDRYVPRLVRTDIPETPAELRGLRAEGTYLITGGSGGLGLRVAGRFFEKGARHIALMGRTKPEGPALEKIEELRRAGAEVVTVQADVAQEEQLARALAEIERAMPPLKGIVHAAGVLDDGALLQQDWEQFARVLSPKVAGAWNLHTLTRRASLDFFVLFSSLASLVGTAGQANYAAANAFLDALAYYRRGHGLPCVSINWGPWAEAGMAASLSRPVHARWEAQGLETLAINDGLEILEQMLRQDKAQLAVLTIDPPKFAKHVARINARILSRVASEGPARTNISMAPAEPSGVARQIEAAPPGERRQILWQHVRDQALGVLGLDPSHPLPPDQPLSELGLDSLMALDLTKALSKSLGRRIPPTLLFNHPTVEAITGHLAEDLSLDAASEPSRAQTPGAAAPAEPEDLSELSRAEVMALLDNELGAVDRLIQGTSNE